MMTKTRIRRLLWRPDSDCCGLSGCSDGFLTILTCFSLFRVVANLLSTFDYRTSDNVVSNTLSLTGENQNWMRAEYLNRFRGCVSVIYGGVPWERSESARVRPSPATDRWVITLLAERLILALHTPCESRTRLHLVRGLDAELPSVCNKSLAVSRSACRSE